MTVPTEECRIATRKLFEATDLFVITLGLCEVWYRKDTNQVLWKAVPKDKFDESILQLYIIMTCKVYMVSKFYHWMKILQIWKRW